MSLEEDTNLEEKKNNREYTRLFVRELTCTFLYVYKVSRFQETDARPRWQRRDEHDAPGVDDAERQ